MLSPAELGRMFTFGALAFSGTAPVSGAVVDQLGPRTASALSGLLCVLAFAGLAVRTDAAGLTLAYAALSAGGFGGYLASLSLGNSHASRWHPPLLWPKQGAKIITTLSCLVDVSAITFVALFATQRRLPTAACLASPFIFGGMAVATVMLHLVLWRSWGRVMLPAAVSATARAEAAGSAGAPALWAQLRSVHFAQVLCFAAVHSLACGHALAHLPARVAAASGGGGASLAEVASVLMTVGCLPAIPLVTRVLEVGLARAMTVVNGLGLLFVALSLVPVALAPLCSAFVFAAYRGLLYSTINLFHARVFGPLIMGRTIGAMSVLSSAPLFFLQQPLFGGGVQFARAQRVLGGAVLLLAASTELYSRRNAARLRAAGPDGGASSPAA
ncbi:hypothetical protein T492DRAFT_1106934 [Pavlovales sp. CCMP2436]|nr:hypothetical protein T492DRAFT_1106934 [Pavlovales sp. CCMP2436]